MAKKKATKHEMKERFIDISQWFIQGLQYSQIIDNISEKYDIRNSSARSILTRYYALQKEVVKQDIDNMASTSKQRYTDLYYRAMAENNLSLAAHIQSRLDKIAGIEMKDNNTTVINITKPESIFIEAVDVQK